MHNYIPRIIGVIFLVIILNNIDIDELYIIFSKINISYFLISLFLAIPFFTLKIFRWKAIINDYGINYSFFDSAITYGSGLFIGQVTPGQIGEVYRGVILSKKGHDLSLSTTSVIFERLVDFIFIFILAIPGFFIFLNISVLQFSIGIFIIIVILYLINTYDKISFLSSYFLSFSIIMKIIDYTKNVFRQLKSSIRNTKLIKTVFFYTLITTLLYLTRIYFLLKALNIELPLQYFVFGNYFASIIALIPISFAGIGTRDAALALVFIKSNQPVESAIALSIMILAMNVIVPIIWGFPSWLFESKKESI